MGCVSSKHLKKQINEDIIINNGSHHVVSLTSTTYGALKLDKNDPKCQNQVQEPEPEPETEQETEEIIEEMEMVKSAEKIEEKKENELGLEAATEVINTWELMGDLEEEVIVKKNTPKSRFKDVDIRSPLKFLNQIGSPRKAKTFGGKENKARRMSDFSPKPGFKFSTPKTSKAVMRLSYPIKDSPVGGSSRRRSFSPLFDPELVALYEKELTEEEEQIKRIVSLTPKPNQKLKKSIVSESILSSLEEKCPPGGQNSVVVYTTTLRGIRKTFEDCTAVRSIIESYNIRVLERDISMDFGLKEELRRLMGSKEVKVPLIFIKGRLLGGAEEVLKLEEEGKLGILFDGMPKGIAGGCEVCGGIRFVMCMECNGSRKVMDEEQKKMVKCGDCNENGLIICPICY